jgi:hypothetical protein
MNSGSARDSRAGDGDPAIANFFLLGRLFRRVAETGTRVACAPQNKRTALTRLTGR